MSPPSFFAQVDEFRVVSRLLGGLRAIRLESDGKSAKPSWHLDHVVIQVGLGSEALPIPVPAAVFKRPRFFIQMPSSRCGRPSI